MIKTDFIHLSKIVSHALRHEPQSYNLQLDHQGWVALAELVVALNLKKIKVAEEDIIEMVKNSEKKRHQISEGKIRAYYGHSLEEKIVKQSSEPPEFLYHGTIQDSVHGIQSQGLLPMNRQYVHLSSDESTARIVGSRRKGNLVILKVKAKDAYVSGIQFYEEQNGIWLSDPIPAKYITALWN